MSDVQPRTVKEPVSGMQPLRSSVLARARNQAAREERNSGENPVNSLLIPEHAKEPRSRGGVPDPSLQEQVIRKQSPQQRRLFQYQEPARETIHQNPRRGAGIDPVATVSFSGQKGCLAGAGISDQTFYRWKKKLRGNDGEVYAKVKPVSELLMGAAHRVHEPVGRATSSSWAGAALRLALPKQRVEYG